MGLDRDIGRGFGALVVIIGIALVGWSAWLYHFAVVADTTDETQATWIGIGTLVLVLGCAVLYSGVRLVRNGQGRKSV